MRITHPQWREQLDPVKYPFSDTATLSNVEGSVILDGTFLDCSLYPVGNAGILFISSIVVTRQKVTIYISSPDTTNIASASFNLVSPPNEIKVIDAYSRPAGVLVSESIRLSIFQSWKLGTHIFTQDQTEFAASVVSPRPDIGVRGFVLPDGSVVAGETWIVGEGGVVVSHETITENGVNRDAVRFDIVGDPLFRRRLCPTGNTAFVTPRFIKKLVIKDGCDRVEVEPDQFGNIQIYAAGVTNPQTVLRIRATADGIVVGAVGEETQK